MSSKQPSISLLAHRCAKLQISGGRHDVSLKQVCESEKTVDTARQQHVGAPKKYLVHSTKRHHCRRGASVVVRDWHATDLFGDNVGALARKQRTNRANEPRRRRKAASRNRKESCRYIARRDCSNSFASLSIAAPGDERPSDVVFRDLTVVKVVAVVADVVVVAFAVKVVVDRLVVVESLV